MRNKTVINNSGSGMILLFIAFFFAKLTGLIDWSWFYVTMPLWIGFAIAAIAGITLFFLLLLEKVLK
jgi:hypothetical protein